MLAVAVLAIAACSSSTTSGGGGGGGGGASPDPTIAFCDALDAYGAKLAAFEALTPSNTVVEYQTAGSAAKAALAVLVTAAAPFAGAQISDLTTAQSQLNAVVDQLPPGATPQMAEVAIDPAVKNVIQEVTAQHNASCNTRPTPSSAP
jgi:hypothetical protein